MPRILWKREEYILVLDLYFRHRHDIKDISAEEIEKYSRLCRKLHPKALSENPRFRSTASIKMRLDNFRHCDPVYRAKGITGLYSNEKGGSFWPIWNEFSESPETLSALAKKIEQSLEGQKSSWLKRLCNRFFRLFGRG